jgi:hypothetical protein
MPLPLPLLQLMPLPLPQPLLPAHTRALTSALAFNVVSAADAVITVPSPPINTDADAATTALLLIAIIHCCPHHLELIVASTIFPCCTCRAAVLLLPLSTTIKYHSSPLSQK